MFKPLYLSDGKRIGMSSSSAHVIYASHILEHFSHREVSAVLSEWHRILKPGGEIFISVPDYSILSKMYNENEEIEGIKMFLMGSQGNPFDFHRNIFDYPSLKALLEHADFSKIQPWGENDYLEYPFEDYAHYEPTRIISLNLKACK